MTTHHAPHLDDTCRALLAAVLAGECPVSILADALGDRGDPREAAVRAAPLRGDVPADVEALAGALFKRVVGRLPAYNQPGGRLISAYRVRTKSILASALWLPATAAEEDELRSLFRRRLAEALGGGPVGHAAAVMRAAEDVGEGEAETRMVREDSRP